ncbi:hypothetical protein [Parapedobacter koreensis]|uniref:WD40-like Beta Propeller Repeat n=1 Tax=Parapedobacter koreensis TaxID=332977 RepID=A0A1H7F928_9SPHI|nr:hypothetical protein [Parapedobacter koreensis]SEK22651.1 hypothetical protein SAMN05421740_101274 [Parapedobacter koreensis]
MERILHCIVAFVLLSSCSKDAPQADGMEDTQGYDWGNHIPFVTSYNTFGMPYTDRYESLPLPKGSVSMSEASGIAYSVRNPGKIWAHNDSGNPNILFLLDEHNGEIAARYQVNGTANLDWEDVEVAVGPDEGKSYLYISDTGDNDERRTNYSIYRFEEPLFEASHQGQLVRISTIAVDRIQFNYPDGSHDTEAMFVDPFTKDIFLTTKRDRVSMLYVLPYPQQTDGSSTCYKAGEFSFREASAATCSKDGLRVLIKNRQDIFYWERSANETMVQLLARTPVKAPYSGEPQGEAVCFDAENNYFTLSEQANFDAWPILYNYLLKN